MTAPALGLIVACAALIGADLLLGGLGLTGIVALGAGLAVMLLGRTLAPMLRRPEDYYDR